MEYIQYGDLHAYIESFPPLSEPYAREVIFQVQKGVDFMHKKGFAHRNLKPAVSNETLPYRLG